MRQSGIVRCTVVVAGLAVALSGLAVAGYAKCTKSTEECAAYMKQVYQTKGWSGMEKDKSDDGTMKVLAVLPNSPAERAGIKAGDVLVSINGVSLSKENDEKIKAMHETGSKIGDTMAFGVKKGADVSTVSVTLEKIPEAVLATMIEKHTKAEHQVARN
jgi:C-terminal processing protease CtpA/Prc